MAHTLHVPSCLGWALRRHRLEWQARTNLGTTDFIDELTALGITVDRSRLSRWELGRLRIPTKALRGYEIICATVPETFTVLAARLQRLADPRHVWVPQDPDWDAVSRSMDLIDQHPTSSLIGLSDLLAVTWGLTWSPGRPALVSRDLTDHLGMLLVDRLIGSTGPAYLLASEAITLAQQHPRLLAAVKHRAPEALARPHVGHVWELPTLLDLPDPHALPVPSLELPDEQARDSVAWAMASWAQHDSHAAPALLAELWAGVSAGQLDPELAFRLPPLRARARTPQRAGGSPTGSQPSGVARTRNLWGRYDAWEPFHAQGTTFADLVDAAVFGSDIRTAHEAATVLMIGGVDPALSDAALRLISNDDELWELRLRVSRLLAYLAPTLDSDRLERAIMATTDSAMVHRLLRLQSLQIGRSGVPGPLDALLAHPELAHTQ